MCFYFGNIVQEKVLDLWRGAVSESTLKPTLSHCSVLHICHDSVRFGQPGDADEVHDSPSVRKEFRSLFKCQISKNPWFALNLCHD